MTPPDLYAEWLQREQSSLAEKLHDWIADNALQIGLGFIAGMLAVVVPAMIVAEFVK